MNRIALNSLRFKTFNLNKSQIRSVFYPTKDKVRIFFFVLLEILKYFFHHKAEFITGKSAVGEPAGYSPSRVELEKGKTYSWCACGLSKKQPLCDGIF